MCHRGTGAQWHSGTVAGWARCVSELHGGRVARCVSELHGGTVARCVSELHGGQGGQGSTVPMCYAVALDGTVPMCYASPSELHSGTVGTVARWHSGTVAQWLEGGPEGRRAGRAGGQGGQEGNVPPGPPQQERDAQRPPRPPKEAPAWQTPGRPNVEGPLKNILGFCQNSGEGLRKYFGILPKFRTTNVHSGYCTPVARAVVSAYSVLTSAPAICSSP